MVKVPGLALSKEPPSLATITSTNGPKLAIGVKPPSPIKDKKSEKPVSITRNVF
jgi:hypothetical protein